MYVILVQIGILHKILDLRKLPEILGLIAYPIFCFTVGTIYSICLIKRIKDIDLIEDLEKDRNFEKIKKIEKS